VIASPKAVWLGTSSLQEEHMSVIRDFPLLVFAISLIVMWLSAQVGDLFRKRSRQLEESERMDLSTVLTATLTLLGLIIAFSFSMAVSRYDQRKNYEAEEANAIGTEHVRAALLPAAQTERVRELLRQYLHQRVLFYETPNQPRLEQIDKDTAALEVELWSAVQAAAAAQPTPVVALVAEGMNDVLNTRGYTQAAWWNRIPRAAWSLMVAIAIFCNLLIGYGAHRRGIILFLILPLALSISFFLISDIDSPRGGVIRVRPQNLESLAQSLNGQ
jgi:hypothetical protein